MAYLSMSEFLSIIANTFKGIGEFFAVKFLPSFVIPVFGIFFGFDDQLILRAMLFLIIFDFITGIIAARNSGEVIKSKGIVRSAFKVAVYGLLISAGHLTEQVTPGTWYIQDAVITFLALTEMISIIENVGKMGYAIPRKLLARLQKLRDEDVVVTEKTTIKEKLDENQNVVETHTVQEKKVESHVTEKPNPQNHEV